MSKPKIEIKTKSIQKFICPETGREFDTEKEALRSAAAEVKRKKTAIRISKDLKELDAQKNWMRLNLNNISDLDLLIETKAKEFWNIDCKLKFSRLWFGPVRTSHDAPVGKQTNWSENPTKPLYELGWSGQVTGTVSGIPKKNIQSFDSVSDTLFNQYAGRTGFIGLHTGTGCPGSLAGEYPMDIGFYMFLEDFPLLLEQYNLFKKEALKEHQNLQAQQEWIWAASAAVQADKEVKDIEAQISKLTVARTDRSTKVTKDYKKNNPLIQSPMDPRWSGLAKLFNHTSPVRDPDLHRDDEDDE